MPFLKPINRREQMTIIGVDFGMHRHTFRTLAFVLLLGAVVHPAQRGAAPDDPVVALVSRLDLERYKDTIKGLTAFGDRREGTDRNRAAVDWIEAQLKSYGCTNTERITYNYQPRPATPRAANAPPPLATGVVGPQTPTAAGGGRPRGV